MAQFPDSGFPESGLFQRAAASFAASVSADPADDGFFGPASVAWRLHADLSAPVAGLRSLILQALHPLAMAGVDQHSAWRADPGARLASTAGYVLTTTYGDRAAARAAAARVRGIHERVHGTDPVTGRPYAATDPALLIWVHAGQVDSTLAAARMYGAEFSAAQQDQYVAEMTAAAELIGIPPGTAPGSVADLDAYFAAVRPQLTAGPAAADGVAYLLAMPDVEPELAESWRLIAGAAIASLPGWARQLYGFGDPEPPGRHEVRQVLGILDAVALGEAGVLEARQRLAARMRAAERQEAKRQEAERHEAGREATRRVPAR
jgi:uncharacterized protein (DUF2236 family)